MQKFIFPLGLALVLLTACKKEDTQGQSSPSSTLGDYPRPNLASSYYNYANQSLPPHLLLGPAAGANNTPADNPVTDAGATLGRVLFYDRQLSLNQTISCSSCHQAAQGFSDDQVLSSGFENGLTGRHSMSLANSAFYANGRFFWDERASSLEEQVLMPIQDEVEMGMSLDSLLARLQTLDYYPPLFRAAFGDAQINTNRISKALAQFIRSMVSYRSRYDVGLQQMRNPNLDFPNFSAEENLGKSLFLDPDIGCAACHGTDAFIAPGPRNNGLDLDNNNDGGVGAENGNANQLGQFKVGSLKNIALTAPYMHDGRFKSLEEVIEHYNSGVRNNPNLSPPLRLPNGGVRRLNLSELEKSALVAFLNTLSDEQMNQDPKFSDPFETP